MGIPVGWESTPSRGLEDAHLLPLLPERTNADHGSLLTLDVLGLEKLILLAEREEVREERVEVAFGAEVEDLRIVRVVEVREDAQKLAVDMFDGGREVLRELAAWSAERWSTRMMKHGGDDASVRTRQGWGRRGDAPDLVGKTFSSSRRFCTQVIT